jgi:flagella basal body P-ring formation protein FlgA
MQADRAQPKRKRSRAFDPRLAIGLALVIGAIAGVVWIVSAADDTVQVYTARAPLAPGDRVTDDDLEPRSVRLDAAAGLYLAPGDLPAAGVIVTRSIAAGELLPSSATSSTDSLRLASVVLSPAAPLAASVGPGATVDVWAARELENRQFGAPVVIVSNAIVVRLVNSDSIVAKSQLTGLEVLVPRSRVARVLDALANGDVISVVPVTLPVGG